MNYRHHQHWARGIFLSLVLGVVTAACSALTLPSDAPKPKVVCVQVTE